MLGGGGFYVTCTDLRPFNLGMELEAFSQHGYSLVEKRPINECQHIRILPFAE